MKMPVRYVVRLMIFAVVAASLLMISAPSDRGSSPYLSSLSNVVVANAYAAKPGGGCSNSACAHIKGTTKYSCGRILDLSNCTLTGGGNNCSTNAC
jgi:hypothetical protein